MFTFNYFAAKCSTALVDWGNFLGGIQKTFVCILYIFVLSLIKIQVDSLDFSVIKPLEVLTDKEIPEALVSLSLYLACSLSAEENLF